MLRGTDSSVCKDYGLYQVTEYKIRVVREGRSLITFKAVAGTIFLVSFGKNSIITFQHYCN